MGEPRGQEIDSRDQDLPTLLAAAWRNRWVVALIVVLFGLIGMMIASRTDGWRAEASLVVRDPATSQIFGAGGVTQPARYVESQLAILESTALANEVLDSLSLENGKSLNELLASRQIAGLGDTDLIRIFVSDRNPDAAVAYANAYLDVYTANRENTAAASFDAALAQLDNSISEVDAELSEIEAEIVAATRTSTDGNAEFAEDLEAAIQAYLDTPDPTPQQLAAVTNQLQALSLVNEMASQSAEIQLLLESRQETADRKAQLVSRRDQVEVDSALALSGVENTSPAVDAAPVSSSLQTLALAIMLGGVVGIAVAYGLDLRNETLSSRQEPEEIFGAPLLGEIPRFTARNADEKVPVFNEPTSPAAEAFRFASATLDARLARLEPDENSHVVAVTSAYVGDGKTIAAVNLSLAAASVGKKVLLVDADFGEPEVTRLILSDNEGLIRTTRGMTNIVAEQAKTEDVVVPVELGTGIQLDLLTRGNRGISAPDFFRLQDTASLFHGLRSMYDLVLIDCPPLLQVSYSTSLVGLADAVIPVVPHRGKTTAQREMRERLGVLNGEVVGYIYNKAPLRPEMANRVGSMKNPLGTQETPSISDVSRH